MASCSFCGKEIPMGQGVVVFKKEGTATRFCCKKCEKNAGMGRNPKKLKWTEKGKKRL